MVCLALELVGSWVVLGFSVGMEAFGLSLTNECSLESGVLWCSQVLSLIVEKLFIINLDILSLVLYRWRSLEATIRIILKSRGRRLKFKT